MRVNRVLPFLVLAIAMPWRPASAGATGPAHLVADLAPGSAPSYFYPCFLGPFDGSMYLSGQTEMSGRELWRTDGTPEGTELVADLCSGRCSSMAFCTSAVFQDALYFNACIDGVFANCRLWKTDGELVSPVQAGLVQDLLVWEGSLYFTTLEGDVRKLEDDGSSELLHHFDPLSPRYLVAGDGVFFVTAWDASIPMLGFAEIWRSDGTAAGTFFISEMDNGEVSAFPFDGKAVFKGPDSRLWVSDGFGAEPLLEEPPFSWPDPIAAIDDVLFVSDGGRTLWRTDGTPEGTFVVAEPGCGDCQVELRSAVYRGELYYYFFFIFGPSSNVLYRTSELGAPEVFLDLHEPVSSLKVLGETLYIGTGWPHPENLWRTTGTPESTSRVFAGSPYAFRELAALDDTLLFDLVGLGASRLGSFAEGDDRVVALTAPPGGASSDLEEIHRNRDGVILKSGSGFGEWWRSDGTAQGTERLPDFRGSVVTRGEDAFFLTDDGILTLDDQGRFRRHFESSLVGVVVPDVLEATSRGLLFLTHRRFDERNVDLWIGDRESDVATRIAAGLHGLGSDFGEVETARLDGGDVLLFIGDSLWRTDGTAEGTRRLGDVNGFGCVACPIRSAVRAGSRVFFESGGVVGSGPRLWRTDGTPEGTVLVRSFTAGWGGLNRLTALGERLFFGITSPWSGNELWTSDGTEEGTHLVRDIRRGGDGAPSSLTPMDGRLFFLADDGVHGRELWTSDGTRRGTVLFRDLFPGPRTSSIRQLSVIDGRLVFAADDGVHGLELWASDGTRRGTRLLEDLNVGLPPSDPRLFTAAGQTVYFSAGVEETGFELWGLDRDALFETLEASFAASRRRTVQAKPVVFTDTSAGRPDGWCWRFGDEPAGAPACSSTTPVARHRFFRPGRYRVELTVERRLPSGLVESNQASRVVVVGAICGQCGPSGDGSPGM